MNGTFDIGDLFYVILTILFIAAGAIGRKKKPPQPQKMEENAGEEVISSPGQDNLEKKFQELFSDYYKPGSEVNTEEIAVEEPAAEETHEIPSVEESQEASPAEFSEEQLFVPSLETEPTGTESGYDFGEAITDRIETEMHAFEWKPENDARIYDAIKMSEGKELQSGEFDDDLPELINDFDARKGIIYSVIMNRKEL